MGHETVFSTFKIDFFSINIELGNKVEKGLMILLDPLDLSMTLPSTTLPPLKNYKTYLQPHRKTCLDEPFTHWKTKWYFYINGLLLQISS